jgi:hypothetical protein
MLYNPEDWKHFLYRLPHASHCGPLGRWVARLPLALATIPAMLVLVDTIVRGSPAVDNGCFTGVSSRHRDAILPAFRGALAFRLRPLVLVWGPKEVSDALFTSMVGCSLLMAWRAYATGGRPFARWGGWPKAHDAAAAASTCLGGACPPAALPRPERS